MAVVDVIELDFSRSVGNIKLLIYAIVLVNTLSPFLHDVHLTAVHLVADHVAHSPHASTYLPRVRGSPQRYMLGKALVL